MVDHAVTAAAIGLLAWAGWSDLATRRIPNRLTGLLAAVAVMRIGLDLAAGGPVATAACDLAVALTAFAAGAALFRFGLFGGGDVKLTAAAALWLGAGGLWPFLAATALAGGALAIGYLAWAALPLRDGVAAPRPPSLPYGVAIAAGAGLAAVGAW